MKYMKRFAIVLATAMIAMTVALCMVGCGLSSSSSQASDASEANTTLIVYYSATGCTEAVAKDIAEYTGADMFAIELEQPYTKEDLNSRFIDSRISREYADPSLRDMTLVQTTPDGWDQYQTIVLGYPIWWDEAAWPVEAFVKANSFVDKTIIPFCTSASSELGKSAEQLAASSDGGTWVGGMRFPSDVNSDEVLQWVDDLGLEKQSLANMD